MIYIYIYTTYHIWLHLMTHYKYLQNSHRGSMDKGLFHTVGFCQEGFLDDWNLHQLTPPWQVGDKLYIIERCFDADHFLFLEVMFLLSNTLSIPIQIQQFYQANYMMILKTFWRFRYLYQTSKQFDIGLTTHLPLAAPVTKVVFVRCLRTWTAEKWLWEASPRRPWESDPVV